MPVLIEITNIEVLSTMELDSICFCEGKKITIAIKEQFSAIKSFLKNGNSFKEIRIYFESGMYFFIYPHVKRQISPT